MDTNSTVRETESNATIREDRAQDTVREYSSYAPASIGLQQFRGYEIVKQLPSSGGESDIYVVGRGPDKFILKLYRYGIEPKIEIINKIVSLSKAHPRELIRVFEFGFDEAEKRWFEIQEYARHGSLRQIIDGIPQFDEERREEVLLAFLREVSNSLKLLHENRILHLDLKPANVLARSLDPIDFVLIDFGISGGLDAELSKRFTAVRGTPMYQAPESWIGAVGEASDWWSLGMAAFEIVNGKHPFSGLSQQVIALSLTTKAIEVPETIPPDKRELLLGLLTRDTSMRWGYDQVSRWLSGERGIPVYFETSAPGSAQVYDRKDNERRPLSFLGEKHTTLETLARVIAKDEASWAKGQELLMRGNIRAWLENNGDFEQAVDVNLLTEDVADPNEKLFRFVHRYGAPLPFVFMGKLMTLNNLCLFLGRHLKREVESKAENVIAEKLCGGGISPLLDFYLRHNEPDGELKELKPILAGIKDENPQAIFDYLNAVKVIKDNMTSEQFIELRETGVTDEVKEAIFFEARDKDGKTALAYAVANSAKPQTITALLKAGADVSAKEAANYIRNGRYMGTEAYRMLKAISGKGRQNRLPVGIVAAIAAVVILFSFYVVIRGYINRSNAGTAQPEDVNVLMFETLDSIEIIDVRILTNGDASPESKLGRLKKLIENGADVNAYSTVRAMETTPLILAVTNNLSIEIMRFLIENGANVNANVRGRTPMNRAARYGNLAAVTLLVESGADVNIEKSMGDAPLITVDNYDYNALEIAALLIENGADVNAKDTFGMTPLINSAKSYNPNIDSKLWKGPELVSLLLDKGADINAKDNRGMTSLMYAAEDGSIEMVSLLLLRGADVNARDNNNRTALSLTKSESQAVQRLLRSAGGAE